MSLCKNLERLNVRAGNVREARDITLVQIEYVFCLSNEQIRVNFEAT